MKTRKLLGIWSLLALSIGDMIGAGIFAMPHTLASYGSLSLIGWGITLTGVLLIAYVFGTLSTIMPLVGGPYAYARAGFGDFIGCQVAWNYWFSIWISSVATLPILIIYIGAFFPALQTYPQGSLLIGLGVIWGLTFLNAISLKLTGMFQILTTTFKVVALALLVICGAPSMSWDNFTPINPSGLSSIQAILATCTLVMWNFAGFESGTIPTDYVKNPKKNILRATVLGTLIVGSLYILVSVVAIGTLPNATLQSAPAPLSLVAEFFLGSWGARCIAITVIVSIIGSLNGIFMVQAQVPLAAAKDGLFPQAFGKCTKDGIPLFGLIVTAICMSVMLYVSSHQNLSHMFTFLVTLAAVPLLITYLFSVLAALMPSIHTHHTPPKSVFMMVALLAFIFILCALAGSGADALMWGALVFFASTPLYIWAQWQHKRSPV